MSLMTRILLALLLNLAGGLGFAGGRYADPPLNRVEVQKASQLALNEAMQGNKNATFENAKKARK